MTLIETIIRVELRSVFISALCLAPVVLGLALFHRLPGARVLAALAAWGAVAIVAMLYVAALAGGAA